jgi:hypothetical protein
MLRRRPQQMAGDVPRVNANPALLLEGTQHYSDPHIPSDEIWTGLMALLPVTDNPRRGAGDNRVLFHLSLHHAARADHCSPSEVSTRENDRSRTDQDIILDDDPPRLGLGLLHDQDIATPNFLGTADDGAVGSNTHVITDDHVPCARGNVAKAAERAIPAKSDPPAAALDNREGLHDGAGSKGDL